MEGPRPPKNSELPAVINFLDSQLRPKSQWSIAREYPLVFSQKNRANIRVIADENKILSHAAVQFLLIKTPIGIFNVAAIGSVVTDQKHRHKGLSRQIIDECIELGRGHKCDFAILWTDLYDFYRKLGFELAGSEVSIVIENEMNIPNEGLKFLKTNKVSAAAILKLYSRHTVGTVRSEEDIKKFLDIPNSNIYTAWDQENNLQAYAVEGKGEDLNGYIHEWGGGVSKVLPLLDEIRKFQQRPITVIAPFHSQNLIMSLLNQNVVYNEGFLGMIKLLDIRNLFFKIRRHARTLGFDQFVMQEKDGYFVIGCGDNLVKIENEIDMVRLIFGPTEPSELFALSGETKKALEVLFPISMWIWGWDSV